MRVTAGDMFFTRRPSRRPVLLARAAAVALATLLAGAAVAAGPAFGAQSVLAAGCVDQWQPVGLPSSLAGMEPQAIASLNGQPAWVVGLASALVRGGRGPMIATWTGTAWQRVPGPWTAYGILNAVAATSTSNAWAVGATDSYERRPISARWKGSEWAAVAVPQPAGQLATFADMALIKGQQLWAVGSRLTDGRSRPLAMKHLSTGWTTHDPPIPANAEGGLADVTRAPGGRLWAAGWRTDAAGGGQATVLYRQNGAWQTSPLDDMPAGRASITDLTFRTASDGWAAGFAETIGGYQPILQRWNGSRWTAQTVSWAVGRSIVLNAVEVTPDGRLTVAGMEVEQLRRDALATLNGATWQVTSVSPGTIEISAMADLARLSDGVVAAGPINRQPLTMFPCSDAMAGSLAPLTAKTAERRSAVEPDHIRTEAAAADPNATVPLPASVSIPGTTAVDVTAAAGLELSSETWAGVVSDFNNDSFDDVFIGRHWEFEPWLMLGSPAGTFTELVADYAIIDRHRCATADVDLSGSTDLYCVIGANKGTTNTPNELLLDVADGGGTWASDEFGLMDGFGRGRDVAFLDLNGDPYPDLYLASEPSRADGMWSSNRLYRNLAGNGFAPAPEWGLDHSFGFGSAVPADLDGDGDDDLLLRVSEPADGREPGARAYLNDGSRFVDGTTQLGLTMPSAVDMEVADFNGDGRLDVVQLSTEALRVRLGGSGPYQKSFELSVSDGVAMAVGDVDSDGRPDIYVARRTAGNSDHMLLVNRDGATDFVSMNIPQPGAGRADDVLAIDHDGNGRTDFVTLNGWSTDGPVKLTAFYPDPS